MPYSAPETAPSLADLFSLTGRSALIVGGAGLLGGEVAHAFAELGADLVLASRNEDRLKAFAATLAARFPGARVASLTVDITNPESVRSLVEAVAGVTGGGLDVLVNSGWSGRKNTFESISEADWNNDIEVCLSGVFRTVRAAFPLLKARRGVVLNIASMYGHLAPDHRVYDGERYTNPPSYGAAKAGVIQLTKYLASFLSPHGIRVNCISPGAFPFESTQQENPEFIGRLAAKNPLNRVGRPHEIKGAAVLLCSDAGAYMTGQNVCIDGGWSAW